MLPPIVDDEAKQIVDNFEHRRATATNVTRSSSTRQSGTGRAKCLLVHFPEFLALVTAQHRDVGGPLQRGK